MDQLKQWWGGLDTRDKRILSVGGIFMACAIFYQAIWQSGIDRVNSAKRELAANQTSLTEMKVIAAKISSSNAKSNKAGFKDRNNQSLFSLADSTAKRTKLRNTPIDVKPDGEDKVRVNIDEAEFDALLQWLGKMKDDYGIVVDNMSIRKLEQSGMVSARMVLVDSLK